MVLGQIYFACWYKITSADNKMATNFDRVKLRKQNFMKTELRKLLLSLLVMVSLGIAADDAVNARQPDPRSSAALVLSALMSERSVGAVEAPVTVIEYASLTCDYCIRFHRQSLPALWRDYVDTGKVRLVYRDFPTSTAALRAAAAARCLPVDRYFANLATLYHTTEQWARTQPIEAGLANVLAVPAEERPAFERCLSDKRLHDAITLQQQTAGRAGVKGTPTFVINGVMVSGIRDYAEMAERLNSALRQSR